jgi:hypothetical protein
MDAEDNGVLEKSRLAMFEFHANEDLAPLEVRLVKVGSWHFDGPARGVGLHQELDSMYSYTRGEQQLTILTCKDTSTFYSITSGGHFIVRKLKLLPRVPVQMEVRAADSHLSNLASLPLPNPFKAMKSRSAEHLPLSEKVGEPGRVSLEEESDLGEVLPRGLLSGFRARRINGRMFAIAWTSEELTVCVPDSVLTG